MPVMYIKDENGDWVSIPSIQGEPGYTPVRGEDFWTEEDKATIVSDVLAALPAWEGGSF